MELTEDENDKSRIPIPFRRLPDRYVERSYLKKNELSMIRDNLEELAEIKGGKQIEQLQNPKKQITFEQESKEVPKEIQSIETKTNESLNVFTKNESEIPKIVTENKDIKLEISNIDNKKNSTVNNKTKKKVKRMSEDDYNPDMSEAVLQNKLDKIEKQKELLKNSNDALRTANETKEKLKGLELKILDMSKEFEGTVDNKFNKINSNIDNKINKFDEKFGQLDNKFNTVHEKLKETCTGIECLTKDFKKSQEEKVEFAECPECTKTRVPFKSSFCPDCGAKMHSWTNDDGTPVKDWKPSWKKLEQ